MPPETLPSADELNRMDDLSGAALYRAEVKRIGFIPRDEQSGYIDAAREGNEAAQHRLILNCLNWTMRRAAAIYHDREPEHTDVMDLIGQANMRMVEVAPKALAADDPISYFMSVAANEMRWHVTYHDPLVKRKRDQPLTSAHPSTVSLEGRDAPLHETPPDRQDFGIVYKALGTLSKRHQMVLAAAYGLHGETVRKNEDIAAMLNVSKATVEKYLWRAKRRLAAKLASYFSELVFG
jgi:RNA polymerase sigma factor (sigma-70 family)